MLELDCENGPVTDLQRHDVVAIHTLTSNIESWGREALAMGWLDASAPENMMTGVMDRENGRKE